MVRFLPGMVLVHGCTLPAIILAIAKPITSEAGKTVNASAPCANMKSDTFCS